MGRKQSYSQQSKSPEDTRQRANAVALLNAIQQRERLEIPTNAEEPEVEEKPSGIISFSQSAPWLFKNQKEKKRKRFNLFKSPGSE